MCCLCHVKYEIDGAVRLLVGDSAANRCELFPQGSVGNFGVHELLFKALDLCLYHALQGLQVSCVQ